MLSVLLGLGVWQLDRLTGKRALLAAIDRAEASPPIPLPTAAAPFTKVKVEGRLRHTLSAWYGAEVRMTPTGAKMGAALIVPLERAEGPPILINRGWVPLEATQAIAQPQGLVTIEGFVRPPMTPGPFSAPDDPARRLFYTLDPQAIGAALGLPHVAPFVIVALGPPPAELFPAPARRLPRPENDHLAYAITWFSLAFVLGVIFFLYARKMPAS